MSKKIRDWLDARCGYRKLLAPIRRRILPGGPSWGYTIANCLVWLLVVEVLTGLLLMSSYSPSATNAWASVHYIERHWAGSFIRGLHYWCAQAMIVLFGVHTIRVLAKAAFRAPRELIWISGLLMLPFFVVWAITGNPLSGSQTGTSQIEVEGNIIGSTPLVGPVIRRILIGGEEVGNLTLTHLYFMHVGLFPLLVGALLAFHIAQVYRHGVTPARLTSDTSASRPYWPYQSVRNMIVFGVVFAVLAYLAWADGAPFHRPADPELPHTPRPEWYFLFLFELRAYFVGHLEFIATIVIPLVALILFLAAPGIDRKYSKAVSAVVRYGLIVVAIGGFGVLTYLSAERDWHDEHFQQSRRHEAALAVRARQLADAHGIPPAGAIELLRNDSETQGPMLFARHCANCHSHVDGEGEGIAAKDPSAPNLHNFATPAWLLAFLDPEQIAGEHVFGSTKHKDGEMAQFVEDELSELDDEQQATLQKIAVALAAEAQLAWRKEDDREAAEDGTIEAGIAALEEAVDAQACLDCHRFGDDGADSAPDLKGYGSYRWLFDFIANPKHERFYGSGNDRMPAYAEFADDPSKNILSAHDIDMLVRWLRGDDRELPVTDESDEPPEEVIEENIPESAAPEVPTTSEPPAPAEVVETVPAGEELFRRKCARCHAHTNEAGEGIAGPTPREEGKPNGAPNLYRFASREWIAGLLDPERTGSLEYFGNTAHSTMADDVTGDLEDLDEDEQAALAALIVAISAEAKLPSQADADQQAADDGTIERGKSVFVDQDVSTCSDCHNFHDSEGDESGPDLTGYGSRQWLIDFISDPTQKRFYGEENDRMPSFAPPDAPDRQLLTPAEIETIVDWLRGENASP